MIGSALTCLSHNIRTFPIRLEFPGSSFNGVFKNFSEDQRSDLEDPGSCLAVIVSDRSLLIVGHPDGRVFSHFVRLVQIPF